MKILFILSLAAVAPLCASTQSVQLTQLSESKLLIPKAIPIKLTVEQHQFVQRWTAFMKAAECVARAPQFKGFDWYKPLLATLLRENGLQYSEDHLRTAFANLSKAWFIQHHKHHISWSK
jgi:hypothetical protein